MNMKIIFSSSRYSLVLRLVTLLFISTLLIIVDARFMPFKNVRFYLDAIVSPLYYLSDTPKKSLTFFKELSVSREALIEQNEELRRENFILKNENTLIHSLEKNNEDLRKLLNSPSIKDKYKMLAEVVLLNSDMFTFQVVLNKGEADGVFKGQPIADEKGILGQVYQTAYKTSRAILICDYQHAIPVRNLRNNMSMVATGNGCGNDLILEYLPNNADVLVGDTLVSSGLDGVFPTGYPVAKVSSIVVDENNTNPHFFATPTADVKQLRYLLLLRNQNETPPLIQPKGELADEQ